MELQGRIIAVLEPRTGTNAKGTWTAQSFVLEVPGEYPKKMCFDVFGDRIARFTPLADGSAVRVSFDIDAHEYQGRWYNSIRAYDIRPADSSSDGSNDGNNGNGGGYPQPCPPQAQGSGVYYQQPSARSNNSLPF